MEKKKKKKFAGDFLYTFSALLLMNIVLQLIIYPLINKYYGAEELGNIVYLSGIIYTICASAGGALSNQKLILRKKYLHTNSDFNIIVILYTIIIFVILCIAGLMSHLSLLYTLFFGLSGCLVFLRYFSEVEFRMDKSFKGYLFYYIIVSVGYVIGFGLYVLTNCWYLIFIIGESLAVIYVLLKGNIYCPQPLTGDIFNIIKIVSVLVLSYLLGAIAAHYYKIFINLYINNTSVTIYYVATFFGKSLDLVITPITTLLVSYLTARNGVKFNFSVKKSCLFIGLTAIVLYVGFVVATPIYTYIFYNNLFYDVIKINFIVNIAQTLSVITSILIVLVLVKLGTKLHFIIQLSYVICYVISTTILCMTFGIMGFAIGACVGYAIRFILIAIVSVRKRVVV